MKAEESVAGMQDVYLFETEQMLDQLEVIVLEKKDEQMFNNSSINEIFRIMHTIKGSSSVMRFQNITEVAHRLEDIFYYLREHSSQSIPYQELISLIFLVLDFTKEELEKVKEGESPDADASAIIEKLTGYCNRLVNQTDSPSLEEEKEEVRTDALIPAVTPLEDSKYYRIKIQYKPQAKMLNLKAYLIITALEDLAYSMYYVPNQILTEESTSDVIARNGFRLAVQTREGLEKIREVLEHASEVEDYTLEESDYEAYIRQDFLFQGVEFQIDLSEKAVKKDTAVNTEQKKAENSKNVPHKQNFMSIDVEKMDALMNLVGELVISEAVVVQNKDLKVPGLDLSNFSKAVRQMMKITSELQDAVMSMRMIPLVQTFQKMNRIVFDTSKKTNKEVELLIAGENTEVDKNIIEHISDPLMHLIRNAVDHGIETKEERIDAGKPEKGKILLEAKNEGGKVWISVIDDGKGMKKEALIQKALEKKMLTEKEAEQISEKAALELIMKPGFSTNETVTEYSGRGVGMDVVAKNIKSVGGSLDIASKPGFGTSMILKIPLTLAIINGIIMEIGSATYVVEIESVKEFLRIEESQMIYEPSGEEYVMIRGTCYPVVRLNEKFGIKGAVKNVEEGIMVVLEHEGRQVCILADKLLGEQEIVVKPIPGYVKKVEGISGCTQLGDGSISLILDPGNLMK